MPLFSTRDTIVAIATPPGRGGIGVVRVSGPAARGVARALVDRELGGARHATFARVVRPGPGEAAEDGGDAGRARALDEVIVTVFPGPASYTGEDVVEVSAHGSPVVLAEILHRAVGAGARLAEPGEFTLRAFLNGRIDLPQAEAVGDLVDAVTPLQARVAFDQLEGTLSTAIAAIERGLLDLVAAFEASIDFPEEGHDFIDRREALARVEALAAAVARLLAGVGQGRLVREGRSVAIVGPPNVGKSSVFNRLAGADRAIVTALPGTTRDVLAEVLDIEGLRVTLFDTAGVRAAGDSIEREGVSRARQAAAAAEALVVVLDVSEPLDGEAEAILGETGSRDRVIVGNKVDLGQAWDAEVAGIGPGEPLIAASALTGEGFDRLKRELALALAGHETLRDTPAVTNVRHAALLEQAGEALGRARAGLGVELGQTPDELVVADLQAARTALEEVTGRRTSEDVLRHIFARFCIGK